MAKRVVATYRGVPIEYELGHYYVDMVGPDGVSRVTARRSTEGAARMFIGFALKRGAKPKGSKVKDNPPLVAFSNPRRAVALLSRRVFAVQYKHAEDKKAYEHKFGAGVCCELLSDGSVRLYHKDGKPLFGEF